MDIFDKDDVSEEIYRLRNHVKTNYLRFARRILIIIIACFFLGVFYIGFQYFTLPDTKQLVMDYKPSVPTIIYDRNGVAVDKLYKEQREPAKFEEIPDVLKEAFLSIEDKDFYSHRGIDVKRNFKSVFVNLASGKRAQGASTITQQLSRNAFLTKEKTFSRKIKEILIAFQLERLFTKEEILSKYLNEIYFGGGAYGIKSATRNFFRKELSEINVAEAALLAAIPNRPEKYNPRKYLDVTLSRAR
ncbi:MAG: transglycosylase domain-containing protein, partial [Fusobacteriaceae bacterium]